MLLHCVGRGSYGEVWLAQNMMGMYRAVKIVHRRSFESERPFERELAGLKAFEPISRSHEGFVDVLHFGINQEHGYFYYVMELGDDQAAGQKIDPEKYSPKTLAREISIRGKLSLPEALQLGLALSDALFELHRQNLVHRDIKPSNIIFVNGVPKLADIGLVAGVDEANSYVGTDGYIPPEGPGTPQADIYSLGKVLYEASTGKDRQDFPELPTLLDTLPESEGFLELNEVVLQACKRDISKRYQSALDLNSDLLVLINGKSVKRLKLLERRLARLKRVGGISAMVLLVLTAVLYQVYREWRVMAETRQRQVGANVAYGNQAMEKGDLLGALPFFADAFRVDSRNQSRTTNHRLRLGSVLAQCPKLTEVLPEGNEVYDAEFSPDGQKMLISEFNGQARIYDLQTGQMYGHPFGQEHASFRTSYSPDGRFIVTANWNKMACIWDAADLKEIRRLPHPDRLFSAKFSTDGLRIVTACNDGVARVWDARTGQLQLELKQHTARCSFADFSHGGKLIVTTSRDYTAQLWDATTGQQVGQPLKHRNWVNYAAFSPDDHKLVTAGGDSTARVWEVATGRPILPDLRHKESVESAEFSPDGRLLLTACLDGAARLWSADTLQPLDVNPILKPNSKLNHAAFSPEGHRILAACSDGSIRLWDLAGGTLPATPAPYSFSDDGSRFLNLTNHGVEVWDASSGQVLRPFFVAGEPIEKASFSHNGAFLLTISPTQTNSQGTQRCLQVRDVATGEPLGPGLCVSNDFSGALTSDDGKRVVTFGGKVAQTWTVLTAAATGSPLEHKEKVGAAFFSSDGNRVFTQSAKEVQVWDAATGRAAFATLRHLQPVSYMQLSPDGSLLVTCCSEDGYLKCFAQVWNAGTGLPVGPRLMHGDGVLFASFSPDSRRLVTASQDCTAIIWDAHAGRQLVPTLRHDHQVQTAAFSPDGKWVVTASWDKTVRVWSAETGDPLTPPLRHTQGLRSARFVADGRRIFATDVGGDRWIWELPMDGKPMGDMESLAKLLSGGTVTVVGGATPAQPESSQMVWERLRTTYPADFTTSTAEVADWHQLEARRSELEMNWLAAAFHLQQLLTMQPGNESLITRLAKAQVYLKSGD
ncbi:MAG: repeat, subgroup [Pedosphaera sp.]|nr:repeat, subgroup [Pedosphaera sp.]